MLVLLVFFSTVVEWLFMLVDARRGSKTVVKLVAGEIVAVWVNFLASEVEVAVMEVYRLFLLFCRLVLPMLGVFLSACFMPVSLCSGAATLMASVVVDAASKIPDFFLVAMALPALRW